MSKQDAGRQPDPKISLRGIQRYLDVVEAPRIENRRLLGLLILMTGALVLLSLGMLRMLPLKERIPYVLQVEEGTDGKPTGRVSVQDGGLTRYTPSEASIRYFLGRWAVNLLSVDEQTRATRLPASYALLRGGGIKDWEQYVTVDSKPLAKLADNPQYRQKAELISITFLSDTTAMIRVKLTRENGDERRVQVNVTYALLPPESDEDVLKNPIGLWITNFEINNELA